ncbi:hypothetical protein [Pulveribacter sp.]|uniref:hypothetical protein n=1 Tax=Pulveribacter sp. TaxID=2678893 RepID=UPI00289F9910|nr:hypothetical protein [Pulveribacter sp.]
MSKYRWLYAAKAAVVHLGISILIILITAHAVFHVWFPYPYSSLAGGKELFLITVAVNVICGPVLTFILVKPEKTRRELFLDLMVISVLQILALGYGAFSITQARPVILAFEADRFVAVTAAEIDPEKLAHAPKNMQELSWSEPALVGTRSASNIDEMLESIHLSMQGSEPSSRPGWWQDYELSRATIIERMKPISRLVEASPSARSAIEPIILQTSLPPASIYYLPLVSRKSMDSWIVLLDQNANIIGYAPVGGFTDSKDPSPVEEK